MATIRKREWTHKGVSKSAWIVTYTDNGGKRRQETHERKKDADAARLRIEGEVDGGTHIAKGQTKTVQFCVDEYLQDCALRRKSGGKITADTIQNYRVYCRHFTDEMGAIPISDIRPERVEELMRQKAKVYSPIYVRSILTLINQVLKFAFKRKWVRIHPLQGYNIETPEISTRIEIPSRADLAKLVQTAYEPTTRKTQIVTILSRRVFVTMALFAGMRGGEICGLQWEHLDFEKRIINVRHSVGIREGLKAPKTKAGWRDIPMSDQVADALLELLAFRQHAQTIQRGDTSEKGKVALTTARWCYGAEPDLDQPRTGFVLLGKYGKHYNCITARKGLYIPLMEDAGLMDDEKPQFGAHTLRHAMASLLISAGLPPLHIKNVMGHASIKTTYDIYGHLFPDDTATASAIQSVAFSLDATTERQQAITA